MEQVGSQGRSWINLKASSSRAKRPFLHKPHPQKFNIQAETNHRIELSKKNAHPGNRTPVSTVGGYYDTTTLDALDCNRPRENKRLIQSFEEDRKIKKCWLDWTENKIPSAHPGNRTPVSTVGGYYDTTTLDALGRCSRS
ncbi:hypothetical protein GQ457_06G029870 [Hibiscus cannabinus]